MDESGPAGRLVDLLQVDDESGGIVFGEGDDLGAEEGDDVLCDDMLLFVFKVGVVDAQSGVEPVHLVGHEFLWNEALGGDFRLDERLLLLLALEDRRGVSRRVLQPLVLAQGKKTG